MQGMYPYSISRKQSEIAMGEDEMPCRTEPQLSKNQKYFSKTQIPRSAGVHVSERGVDFIEQLTRYLG